MPIFYKGCTNNPDDLFPSPGHPNVFDYEPLSSGELLRQSFSGFHYTNSPYPDRKHMNQRALLALLPVFAASVASAQVVIHNWEFNDPSGTDLAAAADSVGSALFNQDAGGGGTWETNASGSLSGLGRIGNADISDVTSGVYQLDLTGVTMSNMAGGTDDVVFFALRSFSSGNNTGFSGAGSSSSNQAVIVFGNENDSGGLDVEVIDNNVSLGLSRDVTTDFSGTFDLRIVLDMDNDSANYFYQQNGGGYTQIVAQQFNGAGTITHLALGSNGFGATVNIDTVTFTAVPEPSTYALLSGMVVLAGILMRRRR